MQFLTYKLNTICNTPVYHLFSIFHDFDHRPVPPTCMHLCRPSLVLPSPTRPVHPRSCPPCTHVHTHLIHTHSHMPVLPTPLSALPRPPPLSTHACIHIVCTFISSPTHLSHNT